MAEWPVERTITSAGKAVENMGSAYDAEVRGFLAEKRVLAVILKGCVKEFRDCSLAEIADTCIEGMPQVNAVGVDKDATNPTADGFAVSMSAGDKITAAANDDISKSEGGVRYDIRFLATAPKSGESIRMILNVEAQRDYYPGYPIVTRGVYYAARMISAQKSVEFTDDHYENIKKVYSIWICYRVPQKRKNTIACYELRERFLAGKAETAAEDTEHYDLMSVLVLGLGDPEQAEKGSTLRMLGTALSATLDSETKKQVLSEEFNIPMTQLIERKVERMCNLSQGIWEESWEAGEKAGREAGESLFAQLIRCLLADQRMADVELATEDKNARLRLYREYKIQ